MRRAMTCVYWEPKSRMTICSFIGNEGEVCARLRGILREKNQRCRDGAGDGVGRVVALRRPATRAAAQPLCKTRGPEMVPALHGPGTSQRDVPTTFPSDGAGLRGSWRRQPHATGLGGGERI